MVFLGDLSKLALKLLEVAAGIQKLSREEAGVGPALLTNLFLVITPDHSQLHLKEIEQKSLAFFRFFGANALKELNKNVLAYHVNLQLINTRKEYV